MARTGKPLKGPKGTRDVYPEDMLRRRYITQAWRDVSIRHGFEEIDGPTFETSDLYAVKSGEGILGELFQAFSGKSPEEVAAVQESGRAPFAMRPEFTPTLARMYAARAKQLPKPCKWFSVGPYFRAERPQRGRLREFLQWNVDVVGDASTASDKHGDAELDTEAIACSMLGLRDLGLGVNDLQAGVFSRRIHDTTFDLVQLESERRGEVLAWLDRCMKLDPAVRDEQLRMLELPKGLVESLRAMTNERRAQPLLTSVQVAEAAESSSLLPVSLANIELQLLADELDLAGLLTTCCQDTSIVRGLAYYTGTVFEVIAEGERAVAGGGRYDNLIELLGGPPTPAVGFAMGDVVLSLLLEDKGLMPEGADLLDACSRPTASLRPEAFVISADEALDAEVRRLVATLRRGKESDAWLGRDGRKPWDADRYDAASEGVRPMHARRSYKATRKIPKLLQDAASQHAKFAVIIEDPETCTVQDLASGKRDTKELADVPAYLASRL